MSLIESCLALPVAATPLLIAVSGGCDSMVLLETLRTAARWPLTVFHLDHHIREDSPLDLALVRDYCQRHKLEVYLETADIAALAAQQQEGIEAAARRYRYQRLQEIAQAKKIQWVVTAHHQDDQLESIILNIFRGAAGHGLAGMRIQRELGDCQLIRPLLQVPRAQLRTLGAEMRRTAAIEWREDSTNDNLDYRRNYMRHQIIPEFERYCPGFSAELLTRAATQRQAIELLETRLDAVWPAMLATESIPLELITSWSTALRAVLWRRLLMHLELPLSRAHIYRCEQLFHAQVSQRFDLANYCLIKNQAHITWFQHQETPALFYAFEDSTETETALFEKKPLTSCDPLSLSAQQACISEAAIQGALCIRNIRAGERWQPLNAPGHKNAFQYLADKKYPQQNRQRLLIVADESGIIWIPGFTIADRVKVKPGDPAVLLQSSALVRHE